MPAAAGSRLSGGPVGGAGFGPAMSPVPPRDGRRPRPSSFLSSRKSTQCPSQPVEEFHSHGPDWIGHVVPTSEADARVSRCDDGRSRVVGEAGRRSLVTSLVAADLARRLRERPGGLPRALALLAGRAVPHDPPGCGVTVGSCGTVRPARGHSLERSVFSPFSMVHPSSSIRGVVHPTRSVTSVEARGSPSALGDGTHGIRGAVAVGALGDRAVRPVPPQGPQGSQFRGWSTFAMP